MRRLLPLALLPLLLFVGCAPTNPPVTDAPAPPALEPYETGFTATAPAVMSFLSAPDPEARAFRDLPSGMTFDVIEYVPADTTDESANGYWLVDYRGTMGYVPAEALADDRTAATVARENRSGWYSSRSVHASSEAAANRTLHRGPRGGCFYRSVSGGKVYVDRSLCGSLYPSSPAATPRSSASSSSRPSRPSTTRSRPNCRTGKPCGNSCIARNKRCRK